MRNKFLILSNKAILSLLMLVLFTTFSCNKSTFHSEKELLHYLADEVNGYKQSKTVQKVNYTLIYRPTDLLVKQELGGNITKQRIEHLRAKYSKYLYFNLSMSKNNKELLSVAPKNYKDFGAMANKLSFGMHKKVHFFTQLKDTIALADYIYPRMFGISKATTIMFVYPKSDKVLKSEFLNFTIQDLGLYTGEVKFKIRTNKLINQPKLFF